MNFKKLLDSSGLVSASRVNYSSSPGVALDRMIPYLGMGSVLFQVSMRGVTVKAIHVSHLMFKGLRVSEEERPISGWIPLVEDGRRLFLEKPSLVSTEVLVRCSCIDFYHTFSIKSSTNFPAISNNLPVSVWSIPSSKANFKSSDIKSRISFLLFNTLIEK